MPLTAAAFTRFGDVIEISNEKEVRIINDGNTERFHNLAKLELSNGGNPGISIFRSKPLVELTLKMMERHPLSSQAFVPLNNHPYLVVVAPAGRFVAGQVEVFHAAGTQGVNYHPGTWHHYLLALEEVSDFLVVDRIADDENCDEVNLPEEDWISVDLNNA